MSPDPSRDVVNSARQWVRAAATAGAGLALATTLAACGSSSGGGTTTSPTGATSTITVSAASSLTEVFTKLGANFMAQNPGLKVTFNFGSSSDLATQIINGAPVDVFASASDSTMQTVVDGGDASNPTTFATNSLEVATPPDNPAGVQSVSDLANANVKVAVCVKDAPCGAAAQTLFDQNNLTVTPVTYEADVKSVLTKVIAGEVDAGLVYITDVQAAGDQVHGVTIPPKQDVSTTYLIAPLKTASDATAARSFVDLVLSPAGQQALTQAGFGKP